MFISSNYKVFKFFVTIKGRFATHVSGGFIATPYYLFSAKASNTEAITVVSNVNLLVTVFVEDDFGDGVTNFT